MNALLLLALAGASQEADEKAVRRALAASVASVNDKDAKAFVEGFDIPRLVREIVSIGDEKPDARRNRVLEASLKVGLAFIPRQTPGGWGEIRTARVTFDGPNEARVYALLKDADGLRERFRYWFVKGDDGAWRLYDFEAVHDALRVSVTMSALLPDAADPRKAGPFKAAMAAFMRVIRQVQESDLEGALPNIREARAGLPLSLAAVMDMMEGACLAGLSREEESLPCFDRAIKLKPDLVRVHRLRAEALFALDRFEEAAESDRAYMKVLGDDSEAWGAIGRAYLELDRPADALNAFKKGAACDEDDSENRLWAGLLLAQARKDVEALDFLRDAAKRSDDPEFAHGRAVNELMARNAPGVLLELLAEKAKKDEPDAWGLWYRGHALRRLGRPAEAEPVLREALVADKDSEVRFHILQDLACALMKLNKPQEARNFAEAIEEGDAGAPTLFVRAILLGAEGKDAEALAALKESFELDAELHARARMEDALVRVLAAPEGVALLAKTKAKAVYETRSSEHFYGERWPRLAAVAEARLKEAPEDVDAWFHRGTALRHLGRHAEAGKALEAGLAKVQEERDRFRFWEELGHALARGGRPADALPWAEKLAADDVWKGSGLYLKAVARAAAGEPKEAGKALAEALEEDEELFETAEKDPVFEALRKTPAYAALKKIYGGDE